MTYEDQGHYVGELGPDNIREGRGIYRYFNGDVYFGGWHDEKFHGLGSYVFESGETFEGNLFQGSKEGIGKYYYTNGTYYSGGWLNDLKHGYGTYEVP